MTSPAWWSRIIEQVDAVHRDDPANLPGATFAIETRKHGPLIGSVGDGWASDTICWIGTAAKAFTGTAVLLAIEEHGVDVHTEVWRLPGMDAYAQSPLKKQIQVRHLLQHTAGLPGMQHYTASPKSPCNDPAGPPPFCPHASTALGPTTAYTCFPAGSNEYIFVDGRCQPARTLTLDEVSRYLQETYDPLTPPGSEFSYSTIGYVIAARIVEQLSGQSINRFIKERLLAPLGMTDSFTVAQPTGDPVLDARIEEGVTEAQRARIADITLITRDGAMPPEFAPGPGGHWDKYRRGWRFVYPDGGLYTTVPDLLRFLRMIRDGGLAGSRRILSPAIIDLLVADHGFGHTMGFGRRKQPTSYGQGPETLEHLGAMMTYCWLELNAPEPLLGVFFSQRLPNIFFNANMGAGMKVIFRTFIPAVKAALS